MSSTIDKIISTLTDWASLIDLSATYRSSSSPMSRQRGFSATGTQVSIENEQWGRLRSTDPKKLARKQYQNKLNTLHMVCKHSPPIDIVESLLKASPSLAMARCSGNELPLHFCTGKRLASKEVIEALVKSYPGAVKVQTSAENGGVTPLHSALTFHSPYATIRILHDACPSVIWVKDSYGRTPWDVAKVQYMIWDCRSWPVLYLLGSRTMFGKKNGVGLQYDGYWLFVVGILAFILLLRFLGMIWT